MEERGETMDEPVKYNLGCGSKILDGYINVDLNPNANVKCDIRKLPDEWEDTADEIMAIHVIEHFYRWEAPELVKEWRRVLKPGGKLILECPNLLKLCQIFLAKFPPVDQAYWGLYGDQRHQDPLMCHRWGYIPETLYQLVKDAGFKRIEIATPIYHIPVRDIRVEGIK
jgi:predicted SAM-dependent methyltransferase